jgi:hypothetical protein
VILYHQGTAKHDSNPVLKEHYVSLVVSTHSAIYEELLEVVIREPPEEVFSRQDRDNDIRPSIPIEEPGLTSCSSTCSFVILPKTKNRSQSLRLIRMDTVL